jgi:vacuolar-type H+-ATPase subunit H
MEDLIMKIIDIEGRAQEIIKDAKEANQNLEANVAKETVKLHEDIEHRAQIKSESIKQIEDNEAEDKIKLIRDDTEKNIAALEKRYNDKKNEWVDKIVNNIIG